MDASILKTFNTVSLHQLDADNLLMSSRFESKYIFHKSQLATILEKCHSFYSILFENNLSLFEYRNDYFDTADHQLYFNHHRQKPLRYKIRRRTYLDSASSFDEIKKKSPDGVTHKYRRSLLDLSSTADFINAHTHYKQDDLIPSIISKYKRITLMNKLNSEKVTIDINLNFENQHKKIAYDNIVIAEVKTAEKNSGYFGFIMKSLAIRPRGMSKYCLGFISLYPEIKHNNFKPIYKQIIKLNSDDRK